MTVSKPMLWLLLMTLAVRGGVMWVVDDTFREDPDAYRSLAENVLRHGVLGEGDRPTAYRPPLYPLMLVSCVATDRGFPVSVGLLHLTMGMMTVGGVYWLGRRWGMNTLAAWMAGMLTAVDPILLRQSTLLMTETPATMLVVASLVLLQRLSERPNARRAVAAGVCLGLASLCRASLLPWAVVLVGVMTGWGVVLLFRRRNAETMWVGIAMALGSGVVLLPWVARNQLEFGRPIATTTHGGYTLLLANNPEFFDHLRNGDWGDVWEPTDFHRRWAEESGPWQSTEDELRRDRLAHAQAWRTIGSDPRGFALASVVRLGRFWSPMPHAVVGCGGACLQAVMEDQEVARGQQVGRATGSRLLVCAWYVVEFVLVAMGCCAILRRRSRRRRETAGASRVSWVPWCGLALVILLSIIHAVYWSNMRMRAPVVPLLALLATCGGWWVRTFVGGRW